MKILFCPIIIADIPKHKLVLTPNNKSNRHDNAANSIIITSPIYRSNARTTSNEAHTFLSQKSTQAIDTRKETLETLANYPQNIIYLSIHCS